MFGSEQGLGIKNEVRLGRPDFDHYQQGIEFAPISARLARQTCQCLLNERLQRLGRKPVGRVRFLGIYLSRRAFCCRWTSDVIAIDLSAAAVEQCLS